MRYSKERIYLSCNVLGHCLAAHLSVPVSIDGTLVDALYLLDLTLSDAESKELQLNIQNSINTFNGTIKALCFIDQGNPLEPLSIEIPLENIYELESCESK